MVLHIYEPLLYKMKPDEVKERGGLYALVYQGLVKKVWNAEALSASSELLLPREVP